MPPARRATGKGTGKEETEGMKGRKKKSINGQRRNGRGAKGERRNQPATGNEEKESSKEIEEMRLALGLACSSQDGGKDSDEFVDFGREL
jgi:hypothetical protein